MLIIDNYFSTFVLSIKKRRVGWNLCSTKNMFFTHISAAIEKTFFTSFFFVFRLHRWCGDKGVSRNFFFRSVTNGKKRPMIMMLIMFSKCTMVKNVMDVLFSASYSVGRFHFLRCNDFNWSCGQLHSFQSLKRLAMRRRRKIERLKHQSWNSIHGPDRLQWSQNVLLLHEF